MVGGGTLVGVKGERLLVKMKIDYRRWTKDFSRSQGGFRHGVAILIVVVGLRVSECKVSSWLKS
jgi:hypothetical protein